MAYIMAVLDEVGDLVAAISPNVDSAIRIAGDEVALVRVRQAHNVLGPQ